MDKNILKEALRKNLDWFNNSGVMIPEDGKWGVAERVLNTVDNSAKEKVYRSFPAWTENDGFSIIEQRRADCNFEVAALFLMASEIFNDDVYYTKAENILDFLYFRSGLLNRENDAYPLGAWNWSHIKWNDMIWFDDNGWNCFLQLLIAEKYPELDAKYQMTEWALKLADCMTEGFNRTFGKNHPDLPQHWLDPEGIWKGRLDLPHWGSLVCMALAMAYKVKPEPAYKKAIFTYHKYLLENRDNFIVSEDAYAVMDAIISANLLPDEPLHQDLAKYFLAKLTAKIDPATGNIPAEHAEAPIGPHLADMIYTVNWALLGLQLAAADYDDEYRDAFEKVLRLVIEIQDDSPLKQYCGCWRGMYDIRAGQWGGGDCYEGGAGSIYTGWTNAPISWVLAFEILNNSLLKL